MYLRLSGFARDVHFISFLISQSSRSQALLGNGYSGNADDALPAEKYFINLDRKVSE